VVVLDGQVTTHSRRRFERVYDLTERVLPRAVIVAPTPEPARRNGSCCESRLPR